MQKIRVNGLTNPLGYNMTYQRISWQNVSFQKKLLRVVDTSANKVLLTKEVNGECNSVELQLQLVPRTKYICLFENEYQTEIGKCYFETGKFDEEWTSRWIASTVPNPVFKTQFEVTEIKDSRLYICSKGIYQVLINGQRITDEVLLPGYYSYDLWQQSNTFDVENHLKVGINTIEIIVTDGWYKGRLGFSGGAINQYGDKLQVITELYQTPKKAVLFTNETWDVGSSTITFSNIYDGEVQDYSQKSVIKSKAEIVDNSKLIEDRMNNQILKQEKLTPTILEVGTNEYLLDFKQNFTGWIEFTDKMNYGQTLKYQVGELLQEGKFYRDNLRTAKAQFKYISDGQLRNVEPLGTFFGFRYALVETEADIYELDLTGVVVHSHLEKLGNFESSSQSINQLYSNINWGQKGNFLDIPTDCPQRDERLGWTGDAQVFSITASLNYDVENFFRNYLYNMRKEQIQNNGIVPLFVPSLRVDNTPLKDGVAGWSDAATIIPWNLYKMYQNTSLLRENYPLMHEWTEHLINNNKMTGNQYLWQSEFQLGDWLSLDGKSEEVPTGGTDTTFIASVYFYLSVINTARAAKVLGYDEAGYYFKYAEKIKTEIHNEFITTNGRLVVDTQTAYALVVEFELFNEEQLDTIKTSFLQRLFNDQFKIKTGFLGTPILLNALEKIGFREIASNMFENESYPGWLYAVNLGATTIWERWNTVLPDGKINPQGMNSLNHYAYGSIANWMYSYLLGLSVNESNKTISINPNLNIGLTKFSGSITTLNGKLEVAVNKKLQQIELEIPNGYLIQNKVNEQKLSAGKNILSMEFRKCKVEELTILQVCSNEKMRSIVDREIPIVFEDSKVCSNLNCKFIDIRNLIVKKRMISEEKLELVIQKFKNEI